MTKYSFKYKKKNYSINVIECKTLLSKALGIMFKKNPLPLSFYFDKNSSVAIHSLFCVPFIAIWFKEDKIVDIKQVKPWRLHVKPDRKFDKLLEIPINNKEFNLFLDEAERFKYLI